MDEDLKRSSDYLKKCFERFQEKCRKNEELTKIVQELKEELNHSNSTVAHYKQILDTFNRAESSTALYNSLKIQSAEIRSENGELKQRVLFLEENFTREKQKIVEDSEDAIARLRAKHAEENDALVRENTELKKTLEGKENYMSNQIQLCQASADLQVDEAENKWKTLLESVNQKLKESNNSCINFRNQIMILRNNVASHKNEIDKLVQEKKEAEEKLIHTENQLILTQEKLMQNQRSTVKKYSGGKQRFNNTRPSTYKIRENSIDYMEHPSQASNSRATNYENVRLSQENNMNYENLHAVQGLYKTKHNVPLLPIQPCTESGGNTNCRKRKLFNPKSTKYLDEMENQD